MCYQRLHDKSFATFSHNVFSYNAFSHNVALSAYLTHVWATESYMERKSLNIGWRKGGMVGGSGVCWWGKGEI